MKSRSLAEHNLYSGQIRLLLWAELDRVGLIVGSERYRSCLAKISELGTDEHSRFQLLIEPSVWQKAENGLKRPFSKDDLVRILGFGRLLTEFALVPVAHGLPFSDVQEVAKLGALSNLIVTVYDHYMDLIPSDLWILSRKAIENSGVGACPDDHEPAEDQRAARRHVVTRLVGTYFERLTRLGHAAAHASLVHFINRIIVLMYDAEMATARSSADYPCERILRRKSALPFVVMGLPIWLAMSEVRSSSLRRHLRWLYGLGEFVGWLDDAIDLDDDRQSGHPNRVHSKLSQASDPANECRLVVQNLARRGERLGYWWRERVGAKNGAPTPCSDAFSAVIVSWFGGMAPRPQVNK